MKTILNRLNTIYTKIKKDKQWEIFSGPSLPKEFILKRSQDSNLNPHIVAHFFPKSPIAEQYRSLRENIRMIAQKQDLQTLAITSASQGEGKSLTALNLAVTMAQHIDFDRVLLIDGDLRRGDIDKSLAFSPKVGLSEYLLINADIDSIVFKTKIDKLSIITRGKIAANSTELLASSKMKELLEKLKRKFSFIIIDTPPVIPIADASIIGSLVDGVLMIMRAGSTKRGVIKHAAEILEHAHANLVGYMLTHVEYHIPHYVYKHI